VGFSNKSQEIIDYRVANKHLPLVAVVEKLKREKKIAVTKQWVDKLCQRAGVQAAAEKYEGSILYVRNVPVDIVESVKEGAKSEGLTMRMKIIELMENYGKTIDKPKVG
jgi:hypothetical protein